MGVNTTILGQQAISIPQGTTAERPASPEGGDVRWNTDLGAVEYYNSSTSQWSASFALQYSADYLIVAGGGSGGTIGGPYYGGGGGGAGGLVTGNTVISSAQVFTATVGSGGNTTNPTLAAGGNYGTAPSGNPSSLVSNAGGITLSATALGGGGGAHDLGIGGNGGSGIVIIKY